MVETGKHEAPKKMSGLNSTLVDKGFALETPRSNLHFLQSVGATVTANVVKISGGGVNSLQPKLLSGFKLVRGL